MMALSYAIRALAKKDAAFVRSFTLEHWGGEEVIVHGDVYYPADQPGFICERGSEVVGLITYRVNGKECEVLTLNSLSPKQGIGTALIKKVVETAKRSHCERVTLVTTNDNLHALGFYQRHGFRISAIRPGAVDESRKMKPGIPLMGENDIPLRDEIVLAMEI